MVDLHPRRFLELMCGVCDTEEVRYQMVSQLDGEKKNHEGFLGMMLHFPIKSPLSLVEIYN